VREALHPGSLSPQTQFDDPFYAAVLKGFYPQDLYPGVRVGHGMSEDCLSLNLWTPSAAAGGALPVMVWLHPGGFGMGGGYSPVTDGFKLAEACNVVVVTLNHRLTGFGYLYLKELGGPRFADSGCVGMLDIIAALEWVQRNIQSFGGDPNNVTLFGESGGSAKVSVLLAMPKAKGLFHKAIMQSNSMVFALRPEHGTKLALGVLDRLGVSPKKLDDLSDIPLQRVRTAISTAAYWPVVDGVNLTHHPFYPTAALESADLPVLIGSNRDEGTYYSMSNKEIPPIDDTEVAQHLNRLIRFDGIDKPLAQAITEDLRNLYPKLGPTELLYKSIGAVQRDNLFVTAESRAHTGKAPTYMYEFAWRSPAFGGRFGASHTFEVPFVFRNLDSMPQLFGHSLSNEEYALADSMSRAWTSFAYTGNPSHSGIPSGLCTGWMNEQQ
jgi:para-nitrobenzyl esterase